MSLTLKIKQFAKSLAGRSYPTDHQGSSQAPERPTSDKVNQFTGAAEPDDGDAPGSDGR